MFLPVGTPPEIAARLNTEFNAALADEKVRQIFSDHSDKYARLVKKLNVKVE